LLGLLGVFGLRGEDEAENPTLTLLLLLLLLRGGDLEEALDVDADNLPGPALAAPATFGNLLAVRTSKQQPGSGHTLFGGAAASSSKALQCWLKR
jgi:hypothetical protein